LAGGTTNVLSMLQYGYDPKALWIFMVGDQFLRPFDLWRHDAHYYMAADATAVSDIKQRNPFLKNAQFITPVVGRPKTFVMNAAMMAPTGYHHNMTSLQMSPGFVGSPFYPGGTGEVTYKKHTSMSEDLFGAESITKLVGGGFVESFAFGGREYGKGLNVPARPFTLADAAGISSLAPGHAIGNTFHKLDLVNAEVEYWPVKKGCSDDDSTMYEAGDGGSLENIGLLPMLQRQARKVAWFLNGFTPIAPKSEVDFCGDNWTSKDLKEGAIASDVYTLFGYEYDADSSADYSKNTVFRKDDFKGFACELQRKKEAGLPAVLRLNLTVQKNEWWGIEGGYVLDSIFSYLDRSADFEDMLPIDTREELERSRTRSRFSKAGELNKFPGYTTVVAGYTAPQVNLLAALTEYAILENKDLFIDLFASGGGSSETQELGATSNICNVDKHVDPNMPMQSETMIVIIASVMLGVLCLCGCLCSLVLCKFAGPCIKCDRRLLKRSHDAPASSLV